MSLGVGGLPGKMLAVTAPAEQQDGNQPRRAPGFTHGTSLPGTLGRTGVISTPHGDIATPAFVPVGTKATVKTVLPEAVASLGAQAVLANAYHLYLQPGYDIIDQAGGLGAFMNWSGPTYTDSGGFQVMSLGAGFKKVISMDVSGQQDDDKIAEGRERLARVDDDGVTFKSHLDGSTHRFTPELSMRIQHGLGADIIFGFDELTTLMNTLSYQENSLERTRLWAIRCLAEHNRLSVERAHRPQQSLWGVIQGAQYEDLRRKAARDLTAMSEQDVADGGKGFGGFGIGGALEKQNLGTIVGWVNSELPQDKPKHLLGISEPDDIFTAIENGADTFDCVSPTRVARNGAIYSLDGRYNVTNARFRTDFGSLDPEIENYTSQYSRAYLHHLFKAKEGLAATLATLHNVSFVIDMVDGARKAIENGEYFEYRDAFLGRYYAGKTP
ncbi:tRNA guanosine(34) transglycosylase Tgt [Gordonia sp. CPCC 205333]